MTDIIEKIAVQLISNYLIRVVDLVLLPLLKKTFFYQVQSICI